MLHQIPIHGADSSLTCNMAGKRKSTIPCMIPAKTRHLQEEIMVRCLPEFLPTIPEDSILSIPGEEEDKAQRTYVTKHGCNTSCGERGTHSCPPCSYETTDLNLFFKHMNRCHVDFRTQPLFYCLNCKVSLAKFQGLALHNAKTHPKLDTEGSPAKLSLQVTKRDGVIRVEQMLFTESEDFNESGISITKMPIMKMMVKEEHKKIVVSHMVEIQRADLCTDKPIANGTARWNVLPATAQVVTGTFSLPMQKVTLNVRPLWSSTLSPDLYSDLPKVMIPLSSIPTYDPAMDLSSFLKASFSKFPYPTKAELCYLTVVSGFPEEQIKLWFTAQRLKQGISWSPEEIEETRRKMFNTVLQAVPKSTRSQSQVPQHCVYVEPSTTSSGHVPHVPMVNEMGWKGGLVVHAPHDTFQQRITIKETGTGLSSQKTESNSVRAGLDSPGKMSANRPTISNRRQNSSDSKVSIINLKNIVGKFDCNVNNKNINCTSKPYTSPASICKDEKATTKETIKTNLTTSSKSNNGSIYKSTSLSIICTKKEGNISDHTSKARGTITEICARGELLKV